jgi:hypothetical protein
MLRRLASNLGDVAARSGRGAFGAVPAVHAQQRHAGGLMVVRLPLHVFGPQARAEARAGSRSAVSSTPRRRLTRRGVDGTTRSAPSGFNHPEARLFADRGSNANPPSPFSWRDPTRIESGRLTRTPPPLKNARISNLKKTSTAIPPTTTTA